METIIFVKSSSRNEPYSVTISTDGDGLKISCDCPAGEWGKFCKHKGAIARGDVAILYDDEQSESFKRIFEKISASKYPSLMEELVEAEKELEAAKKTVKKMKDEISLSMKGGLK